MRELVKSNTYKSNYSLGELVYLKTDGDKKVRIITRVSFAVNGCITYNLSCDVSETIHYECEITRDKPFLNY